MSDNAWDKLQNRRCKHLRCKEMFYDDGTSLEDRSTGGSFWCSRTHHCLGPDGSTVAQEDCASGRTCYEA
jgi:hypothetical protein